MKITNKNKKLKKFLLIIGVVFCFFISIYPLLQIRHTGFYFDDTFNSQTAGSLKYKNTSGFTQTKEVAITWFKEGRILPGIILGGYSTWAGPFKSLIVYKTILIILNLISIILFGYILKLITKSNKLFLLSLILVPIFFQFKKYPDPITSFSPLLQTIWIEFSLSIIFLIKYLRENKKIYFFVSLTLYFLMLLMFYEITYILFPIIILISFIEKNNFKHACKKSLPYILSSILFILIYFYVLGLSKSVSHYPGSTISLNFPLIFQTFIKQIISSIPGIYYFYNKTSFIFINKIDYLYISLISILTFTLLLKIKIKNIKYVSLLGLLLLIIPAIPISISLKYQQELKFGIGYLPVFIQFFGAFCILISLFYLISRINIKSIKIFLITIISITTGYFAFINIENNKVVTEDLNTFYKYPRYLLEQGIKSDLLRDIKDNSTLISINENPWDNTSFYLMNNNKKFEIEYISDLIKEEEKYQEIDNLKLINFENQSYVIGYQLSNKNIGSVFIGKPKKILFDNTEKKIDLLVNNVKIFALNNKDYKYISYKSFTNNKPQEIVKEIQNNQILEINDLIDPKTIYLKTNETINPNINKNNQDEFLLNGIGFKWEDGFSGLEKLNNNYWRWCSNFGKLKIINFNQNSKKIRMSASINSGYELKSNFQININNQEKINFKINNNPLEFEKIFYIKPGVTIIEFNSNAPKINTENDPRDLRFRINNFSTNFF